ncbi:MAG: L-threonylcarbamoyladenylate synthase [Treponema sp.]|nr:L-threonylcarbamoyladenylate synthase [Treponema sp.]
MIIKKSDKNSEDLVIKSLIQGRIAILPTDTVYGFSGIVDVDYSDKSFHTDSVIRSIKGRSETKPLIQLIANPEDIYKYTDDEIPSHLLKKWPGPVTLIVNVKKDSHLSDCPKTVAFRCPGDRWLRNIIERCNAPLYSTSVNRSGQPVLSSIFEIQKEFESETSIIIDDGDKINALPSTIVSLQNGIVKVLRQGSVSV